ncbi:hypothetical protein SAMN04488132_101361 [Sediminibacterium ginsengisoli]|uniref:Uncharacterized protein n=2 Tax=Sediminibacterium ginsengisoli TaxID=413434 RepID=A0A1T4K0N1_9BACT|nr:hypothetical protein SAMN04488132_101361 [Sediminibacterium ginsengisoli]
MAVQSFRINHFYRSTEKAADGQSLIFCGVESSVEKKIVQDEHRKDHSPQIQSNDYLVFFQEIPVFDFSMQALNIENFSNHLPGILLQRSKGIFQPPRFIG